MAQDPNILLIPAGPIFQQHAEVPKGFQGSLVWQVILTQQVPASDEIRAAVACCARLKAYNIADNIPDNTIFYHAVKARQFMTKDGGRRTLPPPIVSSKPLNIFNNTRHLQPHALATALTGVVGVHFGCVVSIKLLLFADCSENSELEMETSFEARKISLLTFAGCHLRAKAKSENVSADRD